MHYLLIEYIKKRKFEINIFIGEVFTNEIQKKKVTSQQTNKARSIN